MLRNILFVLCLNFLAKAQVPSCFYPNGAHADHDYACNLTSEVSFCCGINDVCLENKICVGNGYDGSTAMPWNRGSCTDPTWQSPDCPKFCYTDDPANKPSGGSWIVQCKPNEAPNDVCCYDTTASEPLQCCTNTTATTFTLQGEPSAMRAIESDAATLTRSLVSSDTAVAKGTSTTTSTSATESTPTATSNVAQPSRLSTGSYAGIAVGAVAGLALFCAAALLFYRRQQRNKPGDSLMPDKALYSDQIQPQYLPVQEKDTDKHETVAVSELETRRQTAELSAE